MRIMYILIFINFLVTGPMPRVQTTKTIPMWRINDLLHKGRKGEVAHSFLKDGNWWYKDTEEMTVMCNEKELHNHLQYLFYLVTGPESSETKDGVSRPRPNKLFIKSEIYKRVFVI